MNEYIQLLKDLRHPDPDPGKTELPYAMNYITRKPYLGVNIDLLPKGEWATWKQWQQAGCKVKHGSKAHYAYFTEMKDGGLEVSRYPIFEKSDVEGAKAHRDYDNLPVKVLENLLSSKLDEYQPSMADDLQGKLIEVAAMKTEVLPAHLRQAAFEQARAQVLQRFGLPADMPDLSRMRINDPEAYCQVVNFAATFSHDVAKGQALDHFLDEIDHSLVWNDKIMTLQDLQQGGVLAADLDKQLTELTNGWNISRRGPAFYLSKGTLSMEVPELNAKAVHQAAYDQLIHTPGLFLSKESNDFKALERGIEKMETEYGTLEFCEDSIWRAQNHAGPGILPGQQGMEVSDRQAGSVHSGAYTTRLFDAKANIPYTLTASAQMPRLENTAKLWKKITEMVAKCESVSTSPEPANKYIDYQSYFEHAARNLPAPKYTAAMLCQAAKLPVLETVNLKAELAKNLNRTITSKEISEALHEANQFCLKMQSIKPPSFEDKAKGLGWRKTEKGFELQSVTGERLSVTGTDQESIRQEAENYLAVMESRESSGSVYEKAVEKAILQVNKDFVRSEFNELIELAPAKTPSMNYAMMKFIESNTRFSVEERGSSTSFIEYSTSGKRYIASMNKPADLKKLAVDPLIKWRKGAIIEQDRDEIRRDVEGLISSIEYADKNPSLKLASEKGISVIEQVRPVEQNAAAMGKEFPDRAAGSVSKGAFDKLPTQFKKPKALSQGGEHSRQRHTAFSPVKQASSELEIEV